MDMKKYINPGFTKFINGDFIKKIYPMIDYIEVYEIEEANKLIMRIHVNDPEMTEENMYQRGLDPHYLFFKYAENYLPYFSIPKERDFGVSVFSPEGKLIYSF